MKALVIRGANNIFLLEDEGGRRINARIKGKILRDCPKGYNVLAAGDMVECEPDRLDENKALILSLCPRRSHYCRWNEKGESRQLLAANLDQVVLVCSSKSPPFRPRFVDRVMAHCASEGLSVIVVLNKVDLGLDQSVVEYLALYRGIGVEIYECSALTGAGLDELRGRLASKVSVLTGQSGVGKSELINSLYPGLARKVGLLNEKWDRGNHTTVLAEYLAVGDGLTALIDTPGFRRFALRGMDRDQLAECLPELRGLKDGCRFGPSCSHGTEEGCALRLALDQGKISPERYDSFLRMAEELEANAAQRGDRVEGPRPKAAGRKTMARRPRGQAWAEEGQDDE